MSRIDKATIAQALLTAPDWARVGISDARPWLRADAAEELAAAILHGLGDAAQDDARQSVLTL